MNQSQIFPLIDRSTLHGSLAAAIVPQSLHHSPMPAADSYEHPIPPKYEESDSLKTVDNWKPVLRNDLQAAGSSLEIGLDEH